MMPLAQLCFCSSLSNFSDGLEEVKDGCGSLLSSVTDIAEYPLQKNRDCLEAKKNKKRGRPAGAKNKQNMSVQGNAREMQEERPMERKRLLEEHSYTEIHSSSEDEDEYVDENVD